MRALIFAAAVAACAAGAGFEAGPLDSARLAAAARAAGYSVRETIVDAPAAIRPRLPVPAPRFDDPYLTTLREKYQLEKVVAPAADEWSAQLLLNEWLFKTIPGGNPRVSANRALDILDYASRGEKFYCSHYAISYTECAQALVWQARKLGVDRWHGPESLGSTHHGVAEVWSNQFRKWVVMDPQSNLHFERNGTPLSARENRAAWVDGKASEVKHIVGAPPNGAHKNPAIVWWSRPDEDEIATYFWMYIDTGKRFIFPVDEHNAGKIWYQNDYEAKRSRIHRGYTDDTFVPVRDPHDSYWTVGVVETRITAAANGAIRFALTTYLPNRTGFEKSLKGGAWGAVDDERNLAWTLRPGWNTLRLRARAPRGVTGPESTLMLYLTPSGSSSKEGN